MFGCSLNGSASDYGSSELTLIDSDDEVKNKNGWEEKSN